MTSSTEHLYPIRPAAEVDPTGTFERAYLEVAGMSETELDEAREHPTGTPAPSSGEAEPRRIASTFENATAEELVRRPSPSGVNAEVVAALEELEQAGHLVLCGLNARIDAAPSTAKPVFNGIVDLHDALHHARSALQAQAAASEAGEWVLVPREPTEAMIEDGTLAYNLTGIAGGIINTAEDHVTFIWQAMIPSPTLTEPTEGR